MKEDFSELEIGTTVESFQKFLESQRNLFHRQIDQLKHVVITQCQLTGINPLAQEMAAGALSINIGKRPRDLLNPKAVKYMQSVFAIKDVVSKKESREISALFGISVGQVRDFFVSQRMRVKKIVRLSNEKYVAKYKNSKRLRYDVQTSNDPMSPIDPVPLNAIGPTGDEKFPLNSVVLNTSEFVLQNALVTTSSEMPPSTFSTSAAKVVPLNTICPTSAEIVPLNMVYPSSSQLVPLNTVSDTSMEPIALSVAGPTAAEERPSCSAQDVSEKHFVENIFNLMRKEESFSGQVKLMEQILRMQNSSVSYWFLTQGGVMILASWLSEAANEEQTSVLSVILQVLCHLPMHKALPVHMSVILQSVNQLRFYRMSDISNRARVLLSRWSKVFARSQALRRSNGVKSSSDTQKDFMLTQSISEIMSDESWQSKLENIDGNQVALNATSDDMRKQNPLKLLTSSNDDSSRKSVLGISSKTKGRRKVQLVEQPGQRLANKSQQVAKTVSSSQSRPMSADDIQKAKIRAQFMQSKYGKNDSSSSGTGEVKPEVPKKLESLPTVLPLALKVDSKPEEHQKHVVPQNAQHPGTFGNSSISINLKEPFWKQCQRVQIPWQAPPEIRVLDDWSVGAGENSKETEVQRNRIRRERETIYQTLSEIPPNPKSPWDTEMDYDDTLTPEVPIEQLPDVETPKTDISSPPVEYENRADNAAPITVMSQGSSNASSGSGPGPDLELLAVLLKNPDLVFALTSGQAGSLSSVDMVRVLDTIKSNGAGLLGSNSNLNGVNGDGGGAGVERVEVSLPSPTPPSNPITSGWRPEVAKNPFSKQSPVPAEHYTSFSEGAVSSYGRSSLASSAQPAVFSSLPQQYQSVPPYSLPQRHNILAKNRQKFITPQRQNSPVHPVLHSPTPHVEAMNIVKPQVSIVTNMPDNRSGVSFSLPALFSQQSSVIPESQLGTQSYAAAIPVSNHDSMSNAYSTRQGFASNPYYQVNQNIHGHVGVSWEDKEHVSGDGYESWEPLHSPSNRVSNNTVYGSSYGSTYIPDWSRQQQFPYGYREHGRDGNRSWRGGHRRRR